MVSLRSLVAVALLLPALAPASTDPTIQLGVGTQKVLSIPGGVSRVAVGDPNVADVKPVGSNQMLVIGGQVGRTTLIVWKANGARISYLVVVRSVSTDETVAEIRTLLGDVEGIVVQAVGDRVVLEGEARTADDFRRAEEVVSVYPSVKSFVKLSPAAQRQVASRLNEAFLQAGLRKAEATVIGSTIFLEGSVESEPELRKAELIARAHGEKVENLLAVGIKRMILSEVQFVEVRRGALASVGLRLPTDVAGTVALQGTATAPLGDAADGAIAASLVAEAQTSLRLSIDSGAGRLLAQPTLVCASGDQAEFLAGGEVPVPLITQNSASVVYHKYGVLLRIRPTADRYGNVQTEVEAEVSELDRSVAVAVGSTVAVPGFRNRSVKTSVTVRTGETIALSGVFSRDQQKAVSKVPILGQLPIVGELFKQRTIDDSERELVIFITPKVVNPATPEVRRMIEDRERGYRDAADDVGFQLLD
ncbi:MAG TPA: pilus assembly protein N-terminal domain-containing protein [Vulgatibacter sp.]|nr:pilus assembly protein N-terminal domain-containing protein [Vulgatibacter sp.]